MECNFKIVETRDEMLRAIVVRSIVFVGEQRCPLREEFDGLDTGAIHVLGEENGEPIAAGRIRDVDGWAKLERIAVLSHVRGRRLGHQLVEYMLQVAHQRGFRRFKMHAQAHLVEFYEQHGFEPRGERFHEAGIDHYLMVREDEEQGSASAVALEPPVRLEPGIGRDVEYVGLWARFWASIVDSLLLLVVTKPALIAYYGWSYFEATWIAGRLDFVLSYAFPALATILFWAAAGATPGKMAIRARIVDARTGERPSIGQLVGRYLSYILSALPFCLGFLWIAVDPRKQGWHDKLAGTLVVRAGSEPRVAAATASEPQDRQRGARELDDDWLPF